MSPTVGHSGRARTADPAKGSGWGRINRQGAEDF